MLSAGLPGGGQPPIAQAKDARMTVGKGASRSATNSGILERVFQCYVIAGLFSTSGVDVLLVMTLVFLVFAAVSKTVVWLSRDDLAFSGMADAFSRR